MTRTTRRPRDDWTGMSLADWMATTPSDWMERAVPGWKDRTYGDMLRGGPSDWWTMLYGQAARAPWPGAPPGGGEHRHHHGHHHHHHHHDHSDCGCGGRCRECADCAPDACQCVCCLGDVDLAVYARVGERRVVPVRLENERRREKSVTLELSEWTTRGGAAAQVSTALLEPTKVTLGPCGGADVTLVVEVGDAAGGDKKRGDDRRPTDVDDCLVVSADLRLVGCDHRPVRIAVAILPRDCDAYQVGCGCGCC